MIKLYQVTKGKRIDAKGFWRSDSGKIFVDSIRIKDVDRQELRAQADISFFDGELAIFYIVNGIAIIENNDHTITRLENRKIEYVDKLSSKVIKKWVSRFGGVTVHAASYFGYKLEAWY